MKNWKKLISMSLLVVAAITLVTGCEKREEVKFEGDEGSITFNLKASKKYKISTDKKDLRTSREQAALVGDGFKIGIEFNDDFSYFFDSEWKKLVEKRKDNEDFKELTYSDIKGLQYFYGGYMCYEIYLPIEGSKDYFLVLSVYGKEDNEKSAKEAIKNEEVQDVLNHITKITAKK